MSTRGASDTMLGHLFGSLGRGLYKGCGSDGDVSMVFFGFFTPIDVDR